MTEQETNLQNSLRFLLGRKRMIALVTLAAIIFSVVVSFLLPSTYKATSTLIVIPPPFRPDFRPPSLALETYQLLLKTDTLLKELIEALDLSNRDIDLVSLDRMLSTEIIEQKTGARNTTAFSPLIHLEVRARDPRLAMQIANRWAELFLERNRGLTSLETGYSRAFINKQLDETEAKYRGIQSEILRFENTWHIPEKKKQLEIKTRTLESKMTEVETVTVELETKENEMRKLDAQLLAIQLEGTWIGLMTSSAGRTEEIPLVGDLGEREQFLRQKSLAVGMNLQSAEEAYRKFMEERRLDFKETKYKRARDFLQDLEKELTNADVESMAAKSAFEQLRLELESQDEVLVLSKGIGDQPLWEKIDPQKGMTKDYVELWSRLKFRTEELNPSYSYLSKKLMDTQARYTSFEARKKKLHNEVLELGTEVFTLEKEIDEDTLKAKRLKEKVGIAQKDYDFYFKSYEDLLEKTNGLRSEVNALRIQKDQVEKAINETRVDKQALELLIDEKELALIWLRNSESVLEGTYDLYAQKAEEARVAETEEVVQDVKVVAEAVAPEMPIGPNRILVVVIAGAVGLISGIGLAFFQEFLYTGAQTG